MQKIKFLIPLYLQTLMALVAGTVVGLAFGADAAVLEPFTKWVIQLIRYAAIPLLFLAIFETVIQAEFRGRGLFQLFVISALNACCAIAIGLSISNFFKWGDHLPLRELGMSLNQASAKPLTEVGLADAVSAFFGSSMVMAIFLALALGFGMQVWERYASSARRAGFVKKTRDLASRGLSLWLLLVGYLLMLVPWAVFCAVAKVVGVHGFSMFKGLSFYLVGCLLGMVLHVALVYHGWILGYARMGFGRFWAAAREPVIHAFGINSSLATLPFTLKALERLGVSKASARLSACVGTNFNNDGILLYEVFAALFLAQAYGVDLSIAQQVFASLMAVIACIGVGGIPEAGIISLSIVLGTLQLPLEGITVLLTVDWFIARCRSMINVLGDMTGAVVLDKI